MNNNVCVCLCNKNLVPPLALLVIKYVKYLLLTGEGKKLAKER